MPCVGTVSVDSRVDPATGLLNARTTRSDCEMWVGRAIRAVAHAAISGKLGGGQRQPTRLYIPLFCKISRLLG